MDFGAKMVCVSAKMATFVGVNMLIMDRSIYLVLANGYTIGQDYEQLHRVYVDSITLDLNAAKKRCQEIIDGINVINELSYYLYENGDKYSWQEANVIEIPLSKLEEALHSSCHLLGLFGQEKTKGPDPCYGLYRLEGEPYPHSFDDHPDA